MSSKLIEHKKELDAVANAVSGLAQVIDQHVSSNTEAFALRIYQSLDELRNCLRAIDDQVIATPLMSIVQSLFGDRQRLDDVGRLHRGVDTLQQMVDNLFAGEAHNNDKLQKEFFKQWLAPQQSAGRSVTVDKVMPSAADCLEEDDDIEHFFLIESKETIDKLRFYIKELLLPRSWQNALTEIKALSHTLKGSAGIVDDKSISSLTHELEESINFRQKPSQYEVELLNRFCSLLEWFVLNRNTNDSDKQFRLETSRKVLEELRAHMRGSSRWKEGVQKDTIGTDIPVISPNSLSQQNQSSVGFEQLSDLLEESDAARAMLSEDFRQIRAISSSVAHSARALEDFLEELLVLIRAQRKSTPETKSEHQHLSFRIREVFSDLEEYFRLFEQRFEGCSEGFDKLQEVSASLWKEITKARSVPASRIFPLLRKTVQELSARQDVAVNFSAEGGSFQVEKKVFETLIDPLVQLMRNAISHGLEPAAERKKAGKDEVGNVRVSISNRNDFLELSVADDGRGIDRSELVKQAEGDFFRARTRRLCEDELMFVSGLTTRKNVSENAGRGIGTDVIARGLNKLNGLLQVTSTLGEGSLFSMRVPMNRFYTNAYIVRSLGYLFVVPSSLVCQSDDDPFFRRSRYESVSLAHVLGSRKSKGPKLLVGAVERRFYLEVDEIIGEQAVVLTKLGRFFKNLSLIWGATLIREGDLGYVINLRELARINDYQITAEGGKWPAPQKRSGKQSILAVDDSISVREYLKAALIKHGYDVHLASDGREALQVLQKLPFSLVITDLEMPGIDGYELIQRIREQKRARNMKLMVITSRAHEDEKKRALNSGAHLFLAKPFSEDELLTSVQHLML